MGDQDHTLHLKTENQTKLTNLTICTLNTRTLLHEERLTELEYALEKINYDVIGLAEIRRKTENIVITKSNSMLCNTNAENGNYGVGFYVKNTSIKLIEEFRPITPRLAMLVIKLNNSYSLTIIQVHAPTSTSTDEEINTFYEMLTNTLDLAKINSNEQLIIGDFNARIGQREQGEELFMGPSNYGTRDSRGTFLMNFASEHELKIINSYPEQRWNRKWTWISPTGNKSEIDYMLIKNIKNIRKFEIINAFKFNSDHRLLRATLNIQPKKSRSHINMSANYKTLLLNPVYRQDYKNEVSKKCNILTWDDCNNTNNVQHLYDELVNIINTPIKSQINKLPHGKLSDHTKALIATREELKRIKNKNIGQRIEYAEIRKLVRKEIRNDIKESNNKKAEEIINTSGSTKKLLKEITIERNNWITYVTHNDTKHYNRAEIVNKASEFYKNIFRCTDIQIPTLIERTDEPEIPNILSSEILQIINSLKNNKCPGSDKITYEQIKLNGDVLLPLLSTLFNKILYTEHIPEQWKESIIILLHKKGNRNEITNYRPISLITNLYKIFISIILKRIQPIIEAQLSVEQAGFRHSYSTMDHIHSINLLIQKSIEYNFPLYLLFIDYRRAFDSISHKHLFEALQDMGVHIKYLRIIYNLYKESTAKIHLDRSGPSFSIQRGVRQGDPASPYLFACALESIFKGLQWETKGININGTKINNLKFADDIVLIAGTTTELNEMLQELATNSKQIGLEINMSKTKILTNSTKTPIKLYDSEIEYVAEYIYLGQLISFKNHMEKEIQRRITSTWKKFWSLKTVMKSNVDIKIKQKVFDSCILPCLTYGCQTWTLTKKHEQMIEVAQRKLERSMLNIKITDRVPNLEIRKRSKISDALRLTKKLKWKWAGHIMRMTNSKWTKVITEWTPRPQKRRQGRPNNRWEDQIRKIAGTTWGRVARDRQKWNSMEEAFVQ